MITIFDYSGEKSAKRKVLAYNAAPYPITATEQGHTIGGREAAWVSITDETAKALLRSGALFVTEESIVLGISQPSTD